MPTPPALPARIGPVEFSDLRGMVAIHCPQDLVPILQRAGGVGNRIASLAGGTGTGVGYLPNKTPAG